MVDVVRQAAGPEWWPTKITLQAAAEVPEGLQQEGTTYTVFSLGKAVTAFPIPRTLLALPMRSRSLPISGCLSDEQVDAALCDLPKDFAQTLEVALKHYVGEYHPDIHLAAEIAGLSVRTLQRHLNSRGLTYRELIDQLRFESAIRLIGDDSMTLIDIARQVGYSDSAHFNRAFRRWTGTSPSQYRSLHSTSVAHCR
jgi:AraC-like DNA-binding protein